MSGIFVLVAFVIGVALVLAFMAYGKVSRRKPGRVRPDAPPSREEERSADWK